MSTEQRSSSTTPGRRTATARAWLDRRFARDGAGCYQPHQPLFGFHGEGCERPYLPRLARTLNLLRWVVPLAPRSVLDIGGGDGYLAAVIRHLTGARVVVADLSRQAAARAGETLGVVALAAEGGQQPFAGGAFDLVISSEVIEHLEDPFRCLAEARRVARRWLLVTTQEAEPRELLRRCRLRLRDLAAPHAELNWWHPDDFRALLGPPARLASQYYAMLARDEARMSAAEAAAVLRRAIEVPSRPSARGVGVMGLWARGGAPVPPPIPSGHPAVADWIALLFRPDLATVLRTPRRRPERTPRASGAAATSGPDRQPDPAARTRLERLFHPTNVAATPFERRWRGALLTAVRMLRAATAREPPAFKLRRLFGTVRGR